MVIEMEFIAALIQFYGYIGNESRTRQAVSRLDINTT